MKFSQSVIGRILGSFLVSKPNEALETAVLIYQVQNIERIIGSNKLFARSFYTGLTASYGIFIRKYFLKLLY